MKTTIIDFFDNIRSPEKSNSIKDQVLTTTGVLILGICLGWFSKYLDYRQGALPSLLQAIDNATDLHNFLGRFSLWIVIAVCISVYSHTPIRAAINVFTFFVGFVASYYVYCNFVAGFFPRSYALIWVVFTLISPILAFGCWYSRGDGWFSVFLSAGILSVLMNMAFAYGMFFIDISSWLELIMLLAGILVLRRSFKETLIMMCIAVALAVITRNAIPFRYLF